MHSALNYFSFFNLNGLAQFGESARFAAGDEHLSGDDLIQDEILPSLVKLREHIIQQKNRLFAPFPRHQLPLGKLQTDGRRAGLALRAVGLQIDAGKRYVKIILVRAGQALAGFNFRPVMALQVIQQILRQLGNRCEGIPNCGNGLVF